MEKHELIDPTWLSDCKAVIKQMSPEEKAIALFACKQVSDKLEPEIKKALLDGTIEKFEFIYNGVPTVITISRGKETLKEIENKVIDYDKAIVFAKEHNFEIPMTPPVPPQVDKVKLENMGWFQDNCQQFITKKKELKRSKSYDRFIIKEKK